MTLTAGDTVAEAFGLHDPLFARSDRYVEPKRLRYDMWHGCIRYGSARIPRHREASANAECRGDPFLLNVRSITTKKPPCRRFSHSQA